MKRIASIVVLYLLASWSVWAQVPGGLQCTPQGGRCIVNQNRGTYAIDLGCFDSPDCITGVECEQADYTYDLCTCTIITVGFTTYCGFGLNSLPPHRASPDRERNAIVRAPSCQRTHAAFQRASMPYIRLHQSVLPTIKRLNAGLGWYMHQVAYN